MKAVQATCSARRKTDGRQPVHQHLRAAGDAQRSADRDGLGIKKGIDLLANRGKDPAQMTPTERAAAAKTQQTAREAVKRARQAARITRKLR